MSPVADSSNLGLHRGTQTPSSQRDDIQNVPSVSRPDSSAQVLMLGCSHGEIASQGQPPSEDTAFPAEQAYALLAAACPSESSALGIPSAHPAVSRSRSLTTLIRDLHTEFSDLDEALKADRSKLSLESEARDATGRSADSLEHLHTAVDSFSFSSLLDELDIVAETARTLPIPRPPSLSVDEWECALDSPHITNPDGSIDEEKYLPSDMKQSRIELQEELLTNVVSAIFCATNR